MKRIGIFLFSFVLCFGASAQDHKFPNTEDFNEWAMELLDSLDPVRGSVTLAGAKVTLDIPPGYYFLDAEDAQRVLVDGWDNPPDDTTLGMLFPDAYNPLQEEAWGVTIEYVEDGYISDEDADEIDYDELLMEMKADAREESRDRREQGYPGYELIGWAQPPFYDRGTKRLYWAKQLHFDNTDYDTLNFNIRVLGRRGYMVLNFIASMDQLSEVRLSADAVLDIPQFDPGARYADFNPDIDEVAAYGIGALIAGKLLAKTGFFAVALIFLKKFWYFLAVLIGGLWAKFFRRK